MQEAVRDTLLRQSVRGLGSGPSGSSRTSPLTDTVTGGPGGPEPLDQPVNLGEHGWSAPVRGRLGAAEHAPTIPARLHESLPAGGLHRLQGLPHRLLGRGQPSGRTTDACTVVRR